jgi:hypothetical protein
MLAQILEEGTDKRSRAELRRQRQYLTGIETEERSALIVRKLDAKVREVPISVATPEGVEPPTLSSED